MDLDQALTKHEGTSLESNGSDNLGVIEVRSKTSLRMHYEAQAEVIRGQIGGLEGARMKLGLSQRKISQLLLVDPSSWTRWVKGGEKDVPPHIWRALQWYLALKEQIPGLTPQYFIGKDPQVLHQKTLHEIALEREARTQDVQSLKEQIEEFEKERLNFEGQVQKLKKDLKFHKNICIFVFCLFALWGALFFIERIV
ncbi:MAG: hypothetical protein ACLGGX_09840 [Bdellovibrionia bacterium]